LLEIEGIKLQKESSSGILFVAFWFFR